MQTVHDGRGPRAALEPNSLTDGPQRRFGLFDTAAQELTIVGVSQVARSHPLEGQDRNHVSATVVRICNRPVSISTTPTEPPPDVVLCRRRRALARGSVGLRASDPRVPSNRVVGAGFNYCRRWY